MVEHLNFSSDINNIFFGYIKNNQLVPFSIRSSDDDIFIERSTGINRKFGNIKEELFIAAEMIADIESEISILMSGGLDSEIIAKTFKERGIKFTAYTYRFKNNLNYHDISYAISWCKENNIKHEIIDVDVVKWLENDLYDYAFPLKSISPQISMHHWMIDQTPGYVILGDGRISPRRNKLRQNKKGIFMESYGEKFSTLMWMAYKQRRGAPKFYRYTPELEAAYMFDSVTEDFINITSKQFKIRNFKNFRTFLFAKYFDINFKPKYNGFEKILNLDNFYRNKLKELFPSSDSFVSYEWNLLKKIKLNKDFNWNAISYKDLSEVFDKDDQKDFTYQSRKSFHKVAVHV